MYYRGKVFGGIYDDRFLIKPTKTAVALMPNAQLELPYEGSKKMLLVDSEDRDFLAELLTAMYSELPSRKKQPNSCMAGKVKSNNLIPLSKRISEETHKNLGSYVWIFDSIPSQKR